MKKHTQTKLAILWSFFVTSAAIGMEPHDQLKKDPYESLPLELQKIIRLTIMENAITFLGQQPINLPKECKSSHGITLDLDNNDLIINDYTHVNTWNIITSELKQTIETPKGIPYIKSKEGPGSQEIQKWDNDDHVYKSVLTSDAIRPCAIHKNTIAIESSPYQIAIMNADARNFINTFYTIERIGTVALSDDRVLVSSSVATRVWNLKTRDSHTLRPNMSVTKAKLHNDKALIIGHAGTSGSLRTLQIWDINTGALLKTIDGFTYCYGDVDIAINNQWAVAISLHDKKAWSLSPLQGTTADNPLLWITEKTGILQGNLIRRACQTWIDGNKFILVLPEKFEELFTEIKEDESREQVDCRIYFTLPAMVRAYLKNSLNIRAKRAVPLTQVI